MLAFCKFHSFLLFRFHYLSDITKAVLIEVILHRSLLPQIFLQDQKHEWTIVILVKMMSWCASCKGKVAVEFLLKQNKQTNKSTSTKKTKQNPQKPQTKNKTKAPKHNKYLLMFYKLSSFWWNFSFLYPPVVAWCNEKKEKLWKNED